MAHLGHVGAGLAPARIRSGSAVAAAGARKGRPYTTLRPRGMGR